MDILYYKKIQNAYKTNNRRERELANVNRQMFRHFNDTFDTESVLINGKPRELMIIKDTDGNTFKKKIKSPHNEKFNLGDYVIWNDQTWLITLIDSDEKTWNRGYMYLCTVQLRWQNSLGNIIERFAYAEDFTKYAGGITGNNTLSIGDNQYGLTLPNDEETRKLKRDMRFAIDFDDAEEPEIYKLGNRKVKLNDNSYFGRGGTILITLSFDVFNKEVDKRIQLNGKDVWICNYNDVNECSAPPSIYDAYDETATLSANISGSSKINCGFNKEFKVSFLNSYKEREIYSWNIISDFNVKSIIYDDCIDVLVDDKNNIGKTFIIQIIQDQNVLAEKEVLVIDKF